MNVLEGLEPKRVFTYFEELTRIPRPSYHEKAVSDYLVAFAKEHDLKYYQDDIFNVIMIKEASAGYEDEPPVILQGHMDMVCEKDEGVDKDMEREGLDIFIDGDFIKARGTTLGGDDGVAVAMALAILSDDTLSHPRIEFVCTVSEEVGMDGARGIDLSPLKGRRLINIDSESEGEILASCAGGGTVDITLPADRQTMPIAPATDSVIKISVGGLLGGHSGDEIDKGRANAIHTLAEIIAEADDKFSSSDARLRLLTLKGGGKDNAIPRAAEAVIVIPKSAGESFAEFIGQKNEALKSIYAVADPDISVVCETIKNTGEPAPLTADATKNIIRLILSLPDGVQRMSDDIKDLVETSLNLGIAVLSEEALSLVVSVRSSVGAAYEALKKKVIYIAASNGATVSCHGEYPAWEYRADSPLREKMAGLYKEMYGKELAVRAIHAGLECGILSGKIRDLDAVSMGPDIYDIHTPKERLSISSMKRTYEYIVKLIGTKD